MTARVYHAELWGPRQDKYAELREQDIASTQWTRLAPTSPYYFFVPRDERQRSEYEGGWKITDIMPVNSVGIVTARDSLTIRWSQEEVWDVVRDFVKLPEHEAREKYNLRDDVQNWKVEWAQKDIKESGPERYNIVPILYRPFDMRSTYYTGKSSGFICRPIYQVMRHMLAGENIGLGLSRQLIGQFRHILCSRTMVNFNLLDRAGRFGSGPFFPLYLYPDPEKEGDLFANGTDRHVNLNPGFVKEMGSRLRLSFVPDGTGDLKKTFGPEDVFHYIYAIFHSPTYRERYAEFLKIDFPRVPLTSDRQLFSTLCARGKDLVALHLLESPKVSKFITRYPVPGDNLVEKGHPRYLAPGEPEPGTGKPLKKGRVYISPDVPRSGKKGQYFEGVAPRVWEFHIGGYQVCGKWLKDRRGRKLSYDDLTHYQKVVVALTETIRLMEDIDAAIPDWPIG